MYGRRNQVGFIMTRVRGYVLQEGVGSPDRGLADNKDILALQMVDWFHEEEAGKSYIVSSRPRAPLHATARCIGSSVPLLS